MKVLHITNDYSGSAVYKNLVDNLDNLGVQQIVYTAMREQNHIGKNSIEFKTKGSRIIYRPILNYNADRFFYPWKIRKIFKDIQKQVDLSEIDFIHAHTWYSDGGVAYKLSKKYLIPFIVAIRSTDLFVFQKLQFYLRSYGRKILDKAKCVISITASYSDEILHLPSLRSIKKELHSKLKIIPNGVDSYWIEKAINKRESIKYKKINILYLGTFIRRKNVHLLQEAIVNLNRKQEYKIHLHLVGGGGNEVELLKKVKQSPDLFTYHGKIFNKDQLKEIFQSCDIFAMPSRHETFGLVYVEAMLNGLPILFTKGEGIDGFYKENIGEGIDGFTVDEVQNKLKKIIEGYESYELPVEKLKQNHDWQLIAQKYLKLYSA